MILYVLDMGMRMLGGAVPSSGGRTYGCVGVGVGLIERVLCDDIT